jgi:hypothetical protein
MYAAQVDGQPMAALKPMCDAIGLSYAAQYRKLQSRSWATIALTATVASDGKIRDMVMIDRRTMTMWLATIDESRVNEDARKRVISFQSEAADALDAYFSAGVAVNPSSLSTFDILRAQIDQLETAQRTADEAKALAVKTEARLDAIEGRHDWFSALGYARLNGIKNTSTQNLNKMGRQASMIAKRNGIEPVKVPHHLYGEVNSYPAWIWELVIEGGAA